MASKGLDVGDKWLIAYVGSLGHASCTIQHDKESSLRALVWKVADNLAYLGGRIHVRDAPNNCYRGSGRVAQDIGEVSAAIRIFQAELQN